MWFITKILGFLSGGVLDRVLTHFESKAKLANDKDRINADIVIETVKTEIDRRKVLNEQLQIEHGWAVTRWIRPSFAYPIAIYNAAIYADSMFHFAWDVARVPPEQEKWGWIIITFYFGGRTIESVARIISNGKRR